MSGVGMRFWSCVVAIAAAVVAIGCASDDDSDRGDDRRGDDRNASSTRDAAAGDARDATPAGKAYLFATSVQDGDSSNTYVMALSKLDGEVGLDHALEVSGSSSVFTELGAVFIADSEDMTVTRYEVDAGNQLVDPQRFSMAGEGVTILDSSLFFVIDAKRAYYVDATGGQIIVWNPSTMKIVETLPFLDLKRNGFDGAVYGYSPASAWLLKEKGTLYLPVAWSNYDELTAEPLVALLTISARDPSDQHLYTSDCAAISDEGLLLGLDGTIYLAGTNQWTIFHRFGDMPESAIAKFDVEKNAFAPDYCQNIAELTGGHEAGTAIAYAPVRMVREPIAFRMECLGLRVRV